MRSSKSRSRSKGNRNRSVGNVVNRVFDSSGPEGKVRGTPQQIIDKYNQLARDAQLSNDRVATENFQQHAEHYTRMLAEALREQQERQERQQQNQNNQNNQNNNGQNNQGSGGQQNSQGQQRRQEEQPQPDVAQRSEPQEASPAAAQKSSDDVIDLDQNAGDSGLVETPEERPQRQRRPRKKPAAQPAEADGQTQTPDAAE